MGPNQAHDTGTSSTSLSGRILVCMWICGGCVLRWAARSRGTNPAPGVRIPPLPAALRRALSATCGGAAAASPVCGPGPAFEAAPVWISPVRV